MKRTMFFICLSVLAVSLAVGQGKIVSVKGDILVRHGAEEMWQKAAVGDVLKPDDSMKAGKQSSAVIQTESGKKITVPEKVIVDISDLRDLTQEEFLLKLAMEQVRSVPLPEQNEPNIPRTTTMHGNRKGLPADGFKNPESGVLQLNGTNVLFENGYNATGVLKTKQVYRLYPALSAQVENRIRVAGAFEKLNLTRDALSEYRNLLHETLSPAQKKAVEQKIEQLKRQIEG